MKRLILVACLALLACQGPQGEQGLIGPSGSSDTIIVQDSRELILGLWECTTDSMLNTWTVLTLTFFDNMECMRYYYAISITMVDDLPETTFIFYGYDDMEIASYNYYGSEGYIMFGIDPVFFSIKDSMLYYNSRIFNKGE